MIAVLQMTTLNARASAPSSADVIFAQGRKLPDKNHQRANPLHPRQKHLGNPAHHCKMIAVLQMTTLNVRTSAPFSADVIFAQGRKPLTKTTRELTLCILAKNTWES